MSGILSSFLVAGFSTSFGTSSTTFDLLVGVYLGVCLGVTLGDCLGVCFGVCFGVYLGVCLRLATGESFLVTDFLADFLLTTDLDLLALPFSIISSTSSTYWLAKNSLLLDDIFCDFCVF